VLNFADISIKGRASKEILYLSTLSKIGEVEKRDFLEYNMV
jgi:hypothetical protein